jgi:SAM-dependent methyltransferase
MHQNVKRFLQRSRIIRLGYDLIRYLAGFPGFAADFRKFAALYGQSKKRFPLRWRDREPCLNDRTATTGFDRHYIYQTAWAARILAETRPALHLDISSQLQFCTLVSAFVPVKFYDFRPADLRLSNLTSESADLMSLPFADGSVESLSCMHVVEHIGLGRYGDPIYPDGDLKAMAELLRVLAPGGDLLFVVPVGQPRIVFNAHRIYSCGQVLECFSGLDLIEFALVPDSAADGGLIRNAPLDLGNCQEYGCGCFLFRKPAA